VAHVRPEILRLLEAYARGVNGFLAARPWWRPLPPEFQLLRHPVPEPWRPADSVLFLKLMALDLAANWREELLRARLARRLTPGQLADLWPDAAPADPVTHAASSAASRGAPLEALAAALPEAPFTGLGSNVWAVAGGRSATGAPLLANDPHLALTAPGPGYLAHLEAPGLAVIGATLPAVPFVVLGRNREAAWGFTNTGSDVQDLFLEAVDPTDSGRYLTPEGPAAFASRTEEIRVRGAGVERLVVRETRHGPVISDVAPSAAAAVGEGGRVVALAWTGLDPADRTVEAGFDVAGARDWDGSWPRSGPSARRSRTWPTPTAPAGSG
jgi:penicillin amidase